MKTPTPPDWFSILFAWTITGVVLALYSASPGGIRQNERLTFLMLLWAIGTTAGFVGMQRLKRGHAREYAELGCPKLWGSPFDDRTRPFLGYLFQLRFIRLRDPVVSMGFGTYLALSLACILWLLTFALPR